MWMNVVLKKLHTHILELGIRYNVCWEKESSYKTEWKERKLPLKVKFTLIQKNFDENCYKMQYYELKCQKIVADEM